MTPIIVPRITVIEYRGIKLAVLLAAEQHASEWSGRGIDMVAIGAGETREDALERAELFCQRMMLAIELARKPTSAS